MNNGFCVRARIEILEIVEVEDAEEAVHMAFDIACKTKWHVEKVERMS